jgi:hypothetical protein
MRSRIALSTIAAAALLIGSASAVAAAPADAERGPFEFDVSTTVSGVCPFDFDLSAHVWGTTNFVFTANNQHVGFQMDIHEVDTLTGPNGVPLISEPYKSVEHVGFDGETGVGHDFGTGTIALFHLPDGTTFHSAGRIVNVGGYVIIPDFGHSGDLDALCAALG